jgi:uncharacterized membrane protein YdjX (TVP38/TMEM64 family)
MPTIEASPPEIREPESSPAETTSPAPAGDNAPTQPRPWTGARIARIAAVSGLVTLIALAVCLLMFTEKGQILLHDPRKLHSDVVNFVKARPVTAPVIYLGVYTVFGVLSLPIWWLQLFAGMAFGLPLAVLYSEVASTISAVLAARFANWLAADWFHRLESHLAKLRKMDETFGKNGLLVVMAVRLCHVLPFGLSNYAFGLTTMKPRDIALGTLLGGLPAIITYASLGLGGKPLEDWRFVTGLVILNAILVIPVAVQYFLKRDS